MKIHTEIKVWGKWWMGAIRIRLYFNRGKDYKTFYHIFLGKFSIGMSFPVSFFNLFNKDENS